MKKFLLSAMSLALLATGASAQTTSRDINGYANAGNMKNTVVFDNDAAVKAGPRKIKDGEVLAGYDGANEPYTYDGVPGYGLEGGIAIAAHLDDISSYVGYTLVGMRFAVCGELGSDACAFAYVWNGTDDVPAQLYYDMPNSSDYAVSTITNDQLDLKWNDVYFAEPHTITTNDKAIRYGLIYDQVDDEDDPNAYPILLGKTTNKNNGACYIGYGKFDGKNEGWYKMNGQNTSYTPCIMMILQDASTAVEGINGAAATAKQYFTADGKQLSAPQKGLNIVKMSDGTVRKVVR